MISVEDALNHLFELVSPLGTQEVDLRHAHGRVLAQTLYARCDHPPFDSSSMDGYAINGIEAERHAQFQVVGTAAAGHGWKGVLKPGQAVRIFTGAPIPEGANKVIIQEDVTAIGALITLNADPEEKTNIRPLGNDFERGTPLCAPRLIRASDIMLAAAMNIPTLTVRKRPVIALISTGDELIMPGVSPSEDQIVAANAFGIAAQLEELGCIPRILPIARDKLESLQTVFEMALDVDLIMTIGGASIGDHDLIGRASSQLGIETSFYKVAMRPGKPLMAGLYKGIPIIGLPGNPVSSMVCTSVFVAPLIRAMLGLGQAPAPRSTAILDTLLGPNGPREHYMRAILSNGKIRPVDSQDSALISRLVLANALLIRPPGDPARNIGDTVEMLPL